MFYSFYLSFTDWDGLTEPGFIGIENFEKLFQDPVFYISLENNVIWIITFITIPIALGLFIALALNRKIPGGRFLNRQ